MTLHFVPQVSAVKPKLPGTNSRDSYLRRYSIHPFGSIIRLVVIRHMVTYCDYNITKRYSDTAEHDYKSVLYSGPSLLAYISCISLLDVPSSLHTS